MDVAFERQCDGNSPAVVSFPEIMAPSCPLPTSTPMQGARIIGHDTPSRMEFSSCNTVHSNNSFNFRMKPPYQKSSDRKARQAWQSAAMASCQLCTEMRRIAMYCNSDLSTFQRHACKSLWCSSVYHSPCWCLHHCPSMVDSGSGKQNRRDRAGSQARLLQLSDSQCEQCDIFNYDGQRVSDETKDTRLLPNVRHQQQRTNNDDDDDNDAADQSV
mmetsp:Transcript_6381/g.17406  ORF Transcript_6381/g.17406 Transcript_6381/m.17406 type:complete len:215 (-) Transcript_6381:864-1508(-)